MISVQQACHLVLEHTQPLIPKMVPLRKALNQVLAVDLYAPIDLPPFPQSSMDGYAFAFESLVDSKVLEVKHIIAAGDTATYRVKRGEAVRIFTGAPVPAGADTVVMQEKTVLQDGKISIQDPSLVLGSNRRLAGAEINANAVALSKGTHLGPAAIGFLASMGIEEVLTYPYPVISILVTGNELAHPGQPLQYGKVYDSNSYTLDAGFRQMGVDQISVRHLPDDMESLKIALHDSVNTSDVIVLTGGVSVGDFDFVTRASEEIAVKTIFHKIKQKPGKPMYFGAFDHENSKSPLVFGLPGNPASALTCFYLYVEPCIKKMANQPSSIKSITAPITADYKKPSGITHFLKAHFDGTMVTPLDAQESFRLKSFARANAIIQINEDAVEIFSGDPVDVYLLPSC